MLVANGEKARTQRPSREEMTARHHIRAVGITHFQKPKVTGTGFAAASFPPAPPPASAGTGPGPGEVSLSTQAATFWGWDRSPTASRLISSTTGQTMFSVGFQTALTRLPCMVPQPLCLPWVLSSSTETCRAPPPPRLPALGKTLAVC